MTRKIYALLPALVIILSTCAAAEAQQKGWVLTQRSTTMGDLYTYVSPQGLKWTVPKLGANIATMGPNWMVNMYNEKTKAYYTTNFTEWQRDLAKRDGRSQAMRANPWVKAGAGNVAGLKATKYVMQNKSPVTGGGKTLNSVSNAECWVADDIEVPAQVADMLSNTYGMPKTKYFPLKIAYRDSNGRAVTALDTYRSESRPIAQNYFACPSGFKLVSSKAEVFMDEETQQMMSDMANEMGLDSPRRAASPATQAAPVRSGVGSRSPAPAKDTNELSRMLDSLKSK